MRISDWSSGVCSSDLERCDQAVNLIIERGAHGCVPKDGELRAAMPRHHPLGKRMRRQSGSILPIRAGHAIAGGSRQGIRLMDDRQEGAAHSFPPNAVHLVRTNQQLRSEEHTYELQSLMRSSYAVFCLTKKTT